MIDLRTQTEMFLDILERGGIPAFDGVPQSAPTDPTPIYDQTRKDFWDGWAFVVPRARRTDPPTSHAAARSVTRITETHARILNLLGTSRWGLTDGQLWDAWWDTYPERISPSGLRSRRHELVEMGKVADSGRTARTPSGRESTVWCVR